MKIIMKQKPLYEVQKYFDLFLGLHDLKSPGMIALSVIILIICAFHLIKEIFQVCMLYTACVVCLLLHGLYMVFANNFSRTKFN